MKKIFLPLSCVLLLACSKEKNGVIPEAGNTQPVVSNQSFQVDEHSAAGTSIGIVTATDMDGDDLTYTVNSESGLAIDENTGELSLGDNLTLDFETMENLDFVVSVFDGKAIVEKDFTLDIFNISEWDMLTDNQKLTAAYFKYLTLWKGPNNIPIDQTTKWEEPIKIYLDGTISAEFEANVASVLAEMNALTSESSFSISLVESLSESNTHLFFGEIGEIETLWPDMHDFVINDDTSLSGYASTNGTLSTIQGARIWISDSIEVLFKHELAHAMGLGHSNLCDPENSFMCSAIDPNHEILPMEQDIIRYLYLDDMPGGLLESEIDLLLANLIVLHD